MERWLESVETVNCSNKSSYTELIFIDMSININRVPVATMLMAVFSFNIQNTLIFAKNISSDIADQ